MNSITGKRIFPFVLALSAMAVLPGAALAEKSTTAVNHGWEIVWDDVTATARHVETGGEKELYRDERGETEEEGFTDYRMLSVVGTVVSHSVRWYSGDGAHPSYGTAWTTLNLDPDSSASLADLFGEEAVFSRLMDDATVQSALNGVYTDTQDKSHPTPNNLGELLEYVDGGCHAWMGPSMLKQFYFPYRLGGKIAVVQIGLTHGCEVNRGDFTELTKLYFPIPDKLKADFDQAVKDGVLEDKPFQKASYDCNKAESAIEFAVCTEPELAKLDVAMGKRYRQLRRSLGGDEKARLVADQRNWIKARNTECGNGDPSCLKDFYTEQLQYLENPQAH
ncbi:MAG: DUF1311 domain-containing protein [Alphaproteobacteria bacterium]|nr:DUF1311 domain-containing protein [Alphaproteobacteria bacterium]MCK5624037.1 DUF1311 domain-containing protein [Alphaproteobacteria bacterium]